jgi:hypothetical protein
MGWGTGEYCVSSLVKACLALCSNRGSLSGRLDLVSRDESNFSAETSSVRPDRRLELGFRLCLGRLYFWRRLGRGPSPCSSAESSTGAGTFSDASAAGDELERKPDTVLSCRYR